MNAWQYVNNDEDIDNETIHGIKQLVHRVIDNCMVGASNFNNGINRNKTAIDIA